MIQTLKEIGEIIDWQASEKSAGAPIEHLLRAQDKLSALSYRLAEISAGLKDEYNSAYYIKKVEVSRNKAAFITAGSKIGEAEAQSIVFNEKLIKAEADAEAASYKADLLLRQVNRVLSAMQQRISYAKEEKKRTNPNTHA